MDDSFNLQIALTIVIMKKNLHIEWKMGEYFFQNKNRIEINRKMSMKIGKFVS
jgi:hypothetical protein